MNEDNSPVTYSESIKATIRTVAAMILAAMLIGAASKWQQVNQNSDNIGNTKSQVDELHKEVNQMIVDLAMLKQVSTDTNSQVKDIRSMVEKDNK